MQARHDKGDQSRSSSRSTPGVKIIAVPVQACKQQQACQLQLRSTQWSDATSTAAASWTGQLDRTLPECPHLHKQWDGHLGSGTAPPPRSCASSRGRARRVSFYSALHCRLPTCGLHKCAWADVNNHGHAAAGRRTSCQLCCEYESCLISSSSLHTSIEMRSRSAAYSIQRGWKALPVG